MEKRYMDYVKEELTKCKSKLLEIEKIHGKYSERWHIANAHICDLEYYVQHGAPKNVNQSTEIPYDLIEGF